jgi:hypothetical protein
MASRAGPSRRRRRLTAPEKYQLFLEFISRDGSQREIAERWRVDRTTVLKVVAVAKQSAREGLARSRPGWYRVRSWELRQPRRVRRTQTMTTGHLPVSTMAWPTSTPSSRWTSSTLPSAHGAPTTGSEVIVVDSARLWGHQRELASQVEWTGRVSSRLLPGA